MLSELLALLDQGRAFSQLELAESLGTSQEAVKAQMEYLERLGLLRRVVSSSGCGGCSGSCGSGGCHSCSHHSPQGPPMWEKAPG